MSRWSASDWLPGRSRQLAIAFGGLFYLASAFNRKSWSDMEAMAAAVAVAVLLPWYVRLSDWADAGLCALTAYVTAGRAARLLVQLPFAWLLLAVSAPHGVPGWGIAPDWLLTLAGFQFAALGAQDLAIYLANTGKGYRARNLIVALGTMTALAQLLAPNSPLRIVAMAVLVLGTLLELHFLGLGLKSDWRSVFAPKSGVGLFVGTFNPFHSVHLQMIRDALSARRLRMILVHPNVVPKLHIDALARGEIVIARRERGMRVYARTEKADRNIDYFPTGDRFFEYETRCLLIQLALEEAGLTERCQVLKIPDIYSRSGLRGVITEVRSRFPGEPLHGLHGSDSGGMWNRMIYDQAGNIYPFAVRRVGRVSGTAIRDGARGMTSPVVESLLVLIASGPEHIAIGGQAYIVTDGVVELAKQ